jgi:DNA-binding MarR family transcriptional regulator
MAEFGPIGLTGAQARVIRYLSGASHPVRMADIAAALEVVPRSATSIVDDLEGARLVKREIDPRDRRSILVSLTRQGSLLLDRVARARRRTAEATFNPLSASERAELRRLLDLVCGPCCEPKVKRGASGAYRRRATTKGGS